MKTDPDKEFLAEYSVVILSAVVVAVLFVLFFFSWPVRMFVQWITGWDLGIHF